MSIFLLDKQVFLLPQENSQKEMHVTIDTPLRFTDKKRSDSRTQGRFVAARSI
jgi:sulfatase maturation enzyme AslB (radical SAM superfamily)